MERKAVREVALRILEGALEDRHDVDKAARRARRMQVIDELRHRGCTR